jgi:hypothetical protein
MRWSSKFSKQGTPRRDGSCISQGICIKTKALIEFGIFDADF